MPLILVFNIVSYCLGKFLECFVKAYPLLEPFKGMSFFEDERSLLEVHAISFTASLLLLPVLKTQKLLFPAMEKPRIYG